MRRHRRRIHRRHRERGRRPSCVRESARECARARDVVLRSKVVGFASRQSFCMYKQCTTLAFTRVRVSEFHFYIRVRARPSSSSSSSGDARRRRRRARALARFASVDADSRSRGRVSSFGFVRFVSFTRFQVSKRKRRGWGRRMDLGCPSRRDWTSRVRTIGRCAG